MKTILFLLAAFAFTVCASTSYSQGTYSNPEAKVSELMKTTKTWSGQDIKYPEGNPEITVVELNIDEGFNTGFHCHPVPSFGYILDGRLEVELADGTKKAFTKGQTFAEVVDSWHMGEAVGGPVHLIIVYTGNKGEPITILPKTDDLGTEKCVE